jgi:hypothetical protein
MGKSGERPSDSLDGGYHALMETENENCGATATLILMPSGWVRPMISVDYLLD